MMTRSYGQGKHRRRNTDFAKTYNLLQSMYDKAEDDTDKNSTYAQLKTHDHSYEMLDDGVIWEEDYEKLMMVYSKLQVPQSTILEAICKISNQLTEFSTAELLFKSSAPLWNSSNQLKNLHSYCRTISTLNLNGIGMAILSHPSGTYIAIQKIGTANSLHLIQADEVAIEFFERRKGFLIQLRNKCKGQLKNNTLSELSQQIIFLYHIYRKIQHKVLNAINSKKGMKDQREQEADFIIKNLLRSLRQIKASKMKP